MVNKRPEGIALKITVIYFIVGALWILLSDKFLGFMVNEKESITFFSLIKGWIYVCATGILIYLLIASSFRKLKKTETELLDSYENLSETNKKLELAYKQLADSQAGMKQQYEQSLVDQDKIKESEERYKLISEATNDAIWQEVNGTRIFSDRWFEITGYSRQELEDIGNWEKLIHPDDYEAARGIMLEHKDIKSQYYRCEYRFKAKSGKYIWIQSRGKALFDKTGKAYQMAGSHSDITALKEYEQKLEFLAYHDQLTGLKNRLSLKKRVEELNRSENEIKYALLFVDVDNFKYINDTMGHSFGDKLLISISERLIGIQKNYSIVYRIGGDEFIILVEHYNKKDEIEKIAVNTLKAFKSHFEVGGMSLYTTASIGVSIFPEHGQDTETLLKNADIAVYKAKETGRNRIVFYNEPMNEAIAERMKFEKYLRKALDNSEFELYFQPQIDISSGKISGFEALIRWRNSELGFVFPQKFIGIAEETHLIIPIGEWVLKTALHFLNKLNKLGYGDLNISVNISMLQLLQDDFVDMVIENIERERLHPRQVELEITESILMESYEVIAGKLKQLRTLGVKIALDDFGKGYSSLNYLRQLPITTLKIDKSFVDTISMRDKNKSLTDLIVKIGRSMDLCVIAEGVETQEQMDYLIKHRCHKIQGYLFSKPVPEAEVLRKIEEQYNKISV